MDSVIRHLNNWGLMNFYSLRQIVCQWIPKEVLSRHENRHLIIHQYFRSYAFDPYAVATLIQQISWFVFINTYPLKRDLIGGQLYTVFEQPEPEE